jgi:hypothetical protein
MSTLMTNFVRRVKPVLRDHGWQGSGTTYYARRGENLGVVQFQSSRSSTGALAKITVNLGVWCHAVAAFDDRAGDGNARIPACHWRSRLGQFLSPPRDEWWDIDGTARDEAVSSRVTGYLVDLALPEMDRLSRDEVLRDLWLSGRSPGRTDFQRLYDLSILLARIGPRDRLPAVLDELRAVTSRGRMAFSCADHVWRLEQWGR